MAAKVNGVKCNLLIDTGATVTLLSRRVQRKISVNSRPKLRPVSQTVLAAGGDQLNVYGKATYQIHLGQMVGARCRFIVADINVDGVLGLDFMKSNDCVIDVNGETMSLGDVRIPLTTQGPIGCFRVSTSQICTIPPRSEIVVKGRACLGDTEKLPKGTGIIEPVEEFSRFDRALVGKTLVCSREEMPVRMMNPTDEAKVIEKGTVIGQFHSANIVENTEALNDFQRKEDREAHLCNVLLKDAAANLSKKQLREARELIKNHSQLFALDEDPLGKTGVVKHKIDTGDARPIKQPPRRIPPALAPEVDKTLDKMLQQDVIKTFYKSLGIRCGFSAEEGWLTTVLH